MEAYWPTIPPKPPPNSNIRPYFPGINDNNKQNEQQNDELHQQWILRQMIHKINCILTQMTLDLQCMCKQLQQYMDDCQIEYEKEQLKHKKECKKEQLKHKKECEKYQIKH